MSSSSSTLLLFHSSPSPFSPTLGPLSLVRLFDHLFDHLFDLVSTLAMEAPMQTSVGEGPDSISDLILVSGGQAQETSPQAIPENGYASGFMLAQQLGPYSSAPVLVGDENHPPYDMELDAPASENWAVFQPLAQGVTMFVPFAEADLTTSLEPGQPVDAQPELYAAMDVAQYGLENAEEEPVSSVVGLPFSLPTSMDGLG